MPPTNDPQHLALLLWIGLPLLGVLLALLGWSLRGNLRTLADRIGEVAADVRQLASSVGDHTSRLAAGDEKLRNIEHRLDKLEDRERERLGVRTRTA